MGEFKKYEELNFTDDFMFSKILSMDLELCRELLELILGQKIKAVKLAETQKTVAITGDNKGVRFDVYTESEDGTVYDIEMQTTTSKDLAKRSRYYHDMIDLNMLEKGGKYKDMRDSFVIFICSDGLDGTKPLPVYTYRMRSDENHDEALGDGSITVFVNANGVKYASSKEMQGFLQYLKDGEASGGGGITSRIHQKLIQARKHEDWRLEYMTFNLKMEEACEDARNKALAEGLAKGRNEGESRLAALVRVLNRDGRMEDIIAVSENELLRQKLYEEYRI